METTQLNLSEASRLAGCSVSAVRRWAQTGLVKGSKSDGKWVVEEESLRSHLVTSGGPLASRQSGKAKLQQLEPSSLEVRLSSLNEALKREQAINDELRRENKTLQEEIKALLKRDNEGVLSRWVRTISEVRKSL